MSINCPACSTPIPLDDINVTVDTALCRRCGHSTTYSSLVHAPTAALLSGPPDGCELREDGNTTRIFVSTRSWRFIPLFFAAILLNSFVWIVGIVAIRNGHPAIALAFTIHFLAGLTLLWFSLFFAAGHIEVCINASTVTVYTGVGPVRSKRQRRRNEVQDIRRETRPRKRRSSHTLVLTGIRPLYFGSILTDERRNFLHAAIASKLITIPAPAAPPTVFPRP